MAPTIACANCGAEGESNFSTNYFGELVCELCGTQSYLQNRTETQDAEDMGLDLAALTKMKRRAKRKKRERKIKDEPVAQRPVQLLDCIVATQFVLHEQAEALVRVGFPPEFPRVVRDVWFHFLEVWHSKGARPLLRCFTEFHYQRRAEDKAMDPAVTNDVLEQWDAENASNLERLFTPSQSAIPEDDQDIGPTSVPGETRKQKARQLKDALDWFVLPDMIGMLVLAGRMLNVAALPCDYAHWIDCGELPYYNLVSVCPLEMQETVERVAVFFDATIRTNRISTPVIAYRAHYLQFHLEMRLPPLNAPLIAYNMCENLNFPAQVFRNFQWITANFNIAGDLPEKPLQVRGMPQFRNAKGTALDSAAGIAAYLLAAIRLCPNWNEWIYEDVRQREQHVPPYSEAEADRLPRRELGAFVEFCEQTLLGTDRGRIPNEFASHVDDLKTRLSVNKAHYFARTYEENQLRAYPPEYEDGVCVEPTQDIEKRVERVKTQHGILSGVTDEKVDVDKLEWTVKPTVFYPMYARVDRSRFHAPFEAALELVSEYIDCPMGLVMRWMDVIDRGLRDRAPEFMAFGGSRMLSKALRGSEKPRARKEVTDTADEGEVEDNVGSSPPTAENNESEHGIQEPPTRHHSDSEDLAQEEETKQSNAETRPVRRRGRPPKHSNK